MQEKQPERDEAGANNKLGRAIEDFLKSNPDAKKALDYFGVSNELYEQLMESQSRPMFYTTSSTNTSSPGGELD